MLVRIPFKPGRVVIASEDPGIALLGQIPEKQLQFDSAVFSCHHTLSLIKGFINFAALNVLMLIDLPATPAAFSSTCPNKIQLKLISY